MDFESLCKLIAEVKPSVAGRTLDPTDHLMAELGMDSLDLLQLGRKVQRATKLPFVITEWADILRADKKAMNIGELQAALQALEEQK